jgi:hypothetical protein
MARCSYSPANVTKIGGVVDDLHPRHRCGLSDEQRGKADEAGEQDFGES